MPEYLTVKNVLFKALVCIIVLLIVIMSCALIGPQKISLTKALAGIGSDGSANMDYRILFQIRLPRIFLAAIVGAALACAGVTLQAILRNPLADPYILGISSGAALGVIIALICGASLTFWAGSPIGVFAFCGAIGTVWLVWLIGNLAGGSSAVTSLLLAGVVVNAFFSAVIMFLTSIAKSDQLRTTVLWLMGYLTDKDTAVLVVSSACIIAGILALAAIAQKLNVITLGQAEAQALGVETGRVRLIAFALAAFITAIAVSLTGLIGFVGLIVPHGVRLVTGPDHRQLLPVSAIIGAAFLVLADTIARSIITPAELPVGVITAIAGGPFFLILLARYSRKVSWTK